MGFVFCLKDKGKCYQKIKDLFEDRDAEVFDTMLLNGPVNTVKQNLMFLKYQGTYVHNVY